MDTPNPKRQCCDAFSSIQRPNSVTIAPDFNQNDFDSTISSFLLLPDSPYNSIGCSFDRVQGQVLDSASKASGDDSVRDRLIDRTGKLAFLLLESTKRFSRMRATHYNYNSWSLPDELTIKVFSGLDTKSLMQASACCTMFRKCSIDPLCYSHIDLKMGGKRIFDEIVCSMIHKAGTELRSLKLGRVISSRKGSSFTSTCLTSVIRNHGGLLRSLQLYNRIDRNQVLMRFVISVSSSTVEAFVTSCPSLTTLKLVGFGLKEETVRNLAEGFPKLTYMNLTRTPGISGRFLRDLRTIGRDSPIKTLILRDCHCLDRREIGYFLDSLLNGHFKFIRHIDVTSEVADGGREIIIGKYIITKLKEQRSDVTIVAKSVCF
ncbi:F-box SKIP17-like protein [Arabidopsis thaliana]|uniref:F-box SKIP17-like protein n=1 Tax=Arabidopsis thaliana TaxID=3702 RepID=A0A1P8B5P2_ARATH|nr:F-box SKIP17-like protein [Arabidopsis thaliana]ANM66904.1 F-box SKIP17-like protein [Arabidopsis thaliana]|eukprot:NP_001328771.1 F-box SKIP17-like protein [Arabidopsis thaliana]